MRLLATFAVVVTALSSIGSGASAQGKTWPWCARYDGWTYNCGFATYRQCLATAMGEGGHCYENPLAPDVTQAAPRKRKHRR